MSFWEVIGVAAIGICCAIGAAFYAAFVFIAMFIGLLIRLRWAVVMLLALCIVAKYLGII